MESNAQVYDATSHCLERWSP